MSSAAIQALGSFHERLTQLDNSEVRKRAERDPDYFADHFTKWKRTDFHKKWSRFMLGCEKGETRILLAPREHAKTQQITATETARTSLKDPNFRTAIIMDTADMAKRVGRRIKSILISGEVKEVWGNVRGDKWSDTEFTLAGSSLDEKEATITILSVGGPVTSGHYDRVILDDVVDRENARTQLQRDNTWDWFKMTLVPVSAQGQRWVVGTRYHYDDLYGRLIDPEHWKRGARMLREKALQDDGSALWPEFYDVRILEDLRANLGPVYFGAQYQNDVEAMKGSIFKAQWFRRYKKLPAGLRRYQGYDLAIGDKEFDSFFAGCTIGEEPSTKSIYVIGEFKDRLSFRGQEDKIKEQFNFYDRSHSPVLRIGIESNQYQAALGRQLILETRLPIKQVHHHKDKVTRGLRVQPLFENGKIFFPMEGTEMLEEQLLRFGPDMADAKDIDLYDAFITACEIAGYGGKRLARIGRKPRGM